MASPGVRAFRATRFYMAWSALVALTGGLVMLVDPALYRSGAYDWVRNIMPLKAWGVLWIIVAVACALNTRELTLKRLQVAVGLVVLIHLFWAISIFTLTFQRHEGAFLGAFAWLDSIFWGLTALWTVRPWVRR